MKRTLLIFGLGVALALLAHELWFELRKPVGAGEGPGEDLAWMKLELKLSDTQFARIQEIHRNSSPKLLALASQVSHLREEFAAFERQRRTAGQVDFLEFAHFVETRRAIDKECLQSTRLLVQATAEVMNAQQRERYFGIVGYSPGPNTL